MKVIRKPNPEGQKRLQRALREFGHAQTQVGYFESAKYEDGTPVAYVAAIMEEGYAPGNIPARPTMRPAGKETEKMAHSRSKDMMKSILNGTDTMVSVMTKIGAFCSGSIKKNISELTQPPLAISTVLSRLSFKKQGNGSVSVSVAKPLIRPGSGILLASPTYKVERK